MTDKIPAKKTSSVTFSDADEKEVLDKDSNASMSQRHKLTWQMSTPVSASRASLVPDIAEKYRSILEDLGEDTTRFSNGIIH